MRAQSHIDLWIAGSRLLPETVMTADGGVGVLTDAQRASRPDPVLYGEGTSVPRGLTAETVWRRRMLVVLLVALSACVRRGGEAT